MTFDEWWDVYRAREMVFSPIGIASAAWDAALANRDTTAEEYGNSLAVKLEAAKTPETAVEMLAYARAEELKQALSLIREVASKGKTSTTIEGECPNLQKELRARGYKTATEYSLKGPHETRIDWGEKK